MSKGNSPAFPCQDNKKQVWTGMNLRDYFALEALHGALSNPYLAQKAPMDRDTMAKYVYDLADAMLNEREKFK
jgi:hypothetical protein